MKFLQWRKDKWLSEQGSVFPYDKIEHLILGFVGFAILFLMCMALLNIFYPAGKVITTVGFFVGIASIIVGFIWEVKDGIFTYDGVHIQGFSWKDLIADIVGICFGYLTVLLQIQAVLLISVFVIIPVVFLIKLKR